MLEFQKVDKLIIFPFACTACGLPSAPPFVDCHRMIGNQRVTVCASCCARIDRALGIKAGKRHTELVNASKTLTLRDAELADANARVADLDASLEAAVAEIKALRDERAQLVGRVAQVETRIAESARADLALVAGDAA